MTTQNIGLRPIEEILQEMQTVAGSTSPQVLMGIFASRERTRAYDHLRLAAADLDAYLAREEHPAPYNPEDRTATAHVTEAMKVLPYKHIERRLRHDIQGKDHPAFEGVLTATLKEARAEYRSRRD